MSPYARSWTIFLVIDLASIGFQVNAFAIRRPHTSQPAADLAVAESSHLEVRNELRRDAKVANLNEDAIAQILETTDNSEEIQKNFNLTATNDAPASSTHSNTKETNESKSIESTTNETEELSSTTKDSKRESTSENKETVAETSTIISSSEATSEQTTREESAATLDTSTVLINDLNKVEQTLITTPIELPAETKTERDDAGFTSTQAAEIKEIVNTSKSEPSQSQTQTNTTPELKHDDTTTAQSEETTYLTKQSDFNTETLSSEYSTDTVIPFWKKYTVIERKRVSTTSAEDLTTSTEKEEMVLADTAQSSISFEKAFNITSNIPSLERLRNELLSLTAKPPTTRAPDLTSPVATQDSTAPLSTEETTGTSGTDGTVSSVTNEETTRLDVLTSQRAGFLNYSFKPTTVPDTTTIESKPLDIILNEIGTTSTVGIQDDLRSDKKDSSAESQSQLTEDAIKEELMKEEMLNDNIEYTKQNREERFDIKNINNGIDVKVITPTFTSTLQPIEETSSEDRLSVKPISADRTRNAGIYTVSPNYRPLKKFEVLPSKSFVRNPDDNSWRNESLSSLGIVFKAKNSSKAFTEVLKNKTETEMNAFTEKTDKGEEPELRERLEKIAEIRKSKKKRIDGETVYGDYEESNVSEENINSPKSEDPVPVIVPVKVKEILSSYIPPVVEAVKIETTTKDIPKQVTTTTTQTPLKQYNIESYDGLDDDEADYVTLANIDLKKYILSGRTNQAPIPPAITYTKPTPQYLPERKPTVQYFPPRKPQRVNVPEYDEEFQRKINAYTVNDSPKKVSTYPTLHTYSTEKNKVKQNPRYNTIRPTEIVRYRPIDPNNYNTNDENVAYAVVNQDGNFNRASYVIKHLRDFINEAAKDNDENQNPPFLTENPAPNNEYVENKVSPNDYDNYETLFRREVLERFVDNFNQNSERFKVDFPILYNSSVVHSPMEGDGKRQASSSAFIKRLYGEARERPAYVQKCDPNCDRTVPLVPEYELNYYVPEQEELESRPHALPYRYRVRV